MTNISIEERQSILLSKIKFIDSQIYNNEVDLQLENTKSLVSEEEIQLITERINNCNAQKALLNTMLDQLTI